MKEMPSFLDFPALILQESEVVALHKLLCIGLFLLIAVVTTTIFYTFRDDQSPPVHYKMSYKTSDGLKAYAKFTGKQFLIINHDPFDWTDVTIAINAMRIENQVVSEAGESDELIFPIARIRSGGIHTLEAGQLSADLPIGARPLTAQAYHLSILGMTPWGKSSWDGRWE
jgi:hypothetical protein